MADTSPAWAAVHETHIGAIFLAGDRAYKLKKPVDLGFLDFTTRERRERALAAVEEDGGVAAFDAARREVEVSVPVEVGSRAENRIEITKGLAGTEQVIVSGKDLVTEGVPVEAHPVAAPAASS